GGGRVVQDVGAEVAAAGGALDDRAGRAAGKHGHAEEGEAALAGQPLVVAVASAAGAEELAVADRGPRRAGAQQARQPGGSSGTAVRFPSWQHVAPPQLPRCRTARAVPPRHHCRLRDVSHICEPESAPRTRPLRDLHRSLAGIRRGLRPPTGADGALGSVEAAGQRAARLTAETTAFSEARVVFASIPIPHRTLSPMAHSMWEAACAEAPSLMVCSW